MPFLTWCLFLTKISKSSVKKSTGKFQKKQKIRFCSGKNFENFVRKILKTFFENFICIFEVENVNKWILKIVVRMDFVDTPKEIVDVNFNENFENF